jgi:UDP-glucose 4-epimerase
MARVLVTGAAGYIGSHTCLELLRAGFEVVALDDLSNSSPVALERVVALAGKEFAAVHFCDVRDEAALRGIFAAQRIEAVIHFAAKKAVGESVRLPLAYYENNLGGVMTLTRVMAEQGVKRLVFSSSATVYGDPASVPIKEGFPTSATNPYGRTKLMSEEILRDVAAADDEWKIVLLRYFNPVGAHESGEIGEDPNGLPNNLMPYVSQVAVGRLEQLQVFGGDYPTPDGTGVRDYIHVVDLALGHLAALQRVKDLPTVTTVNLGTGQGYSVLEVVKAFSEASGREVPYRIVARRAGDVAECWADPALATEMLGWSAQRGLAEMCADSWRWQSQNPQGYPKP